MIKSTTIKIKAINEKKRQLKVEVQAHGCIDIAYDHCNGEDNAYLLNAPIPNVPTFSISNNVLLCQ